MYSITVLVDKYSNRYSNPIYKPLMEPDTVIDGLTGVYYLPIRNDDGTQNQYTKNLMQELGCQIEPITIIFGFEKGHPQHSTADQSADIKCVKVNSLPQVISEFEIFKKQYPSKKPFPTAIFLGVGLVLLAWTLKK